MWKKKSPSVLLVEDDESLKDIISLILRELGFEVTLAANGQLALDLISKQKFTLIISDIQMPQLNGVDMLEAIRKRGLNTPVILMTGYSDFLDVNLERRGAAALLEKPFTKSSIELAVSKYLPRKAAAA